MSLFTELVEKIPELTLLENDNLELEITNVNHEVYYISVIRNANLLLIYSSLPQIMLKIITSSQFEYLKILANEPKLMKGTTLFTWPNDENLYMGISANLGRITPEGLEKNFQALALARYAVTSNFCNPH